MEDIRETSNAQAPTSNAEFKEHGAYRKPSTFQSPDRNQRFAEWSQRELSDMDGKSEG
jgi:hypothetical protein